MRQMNLIGTANIKAVVVGACLGSLCLMPMAKAAVTMTGDAQEVGSYRLYVGQTGTGTMRVDGNSSYENQKPGIYVGYGAGADGTVTVDGPQARLGANWSINVGCEGRGSMSVVNGGYAKSEGTISVGKKSSQVATLAVDGAGSFVDANAFQAGGDAFNGTVGYADVTITNGGRIDSFDAAYLGYKGECNLQIDGEGSTFFATKTIKMGKYGEAHVTLSNGGLLAATDINFDYDVNVAEVKMSGGAQLALLGAIGSNTSQDEGQDVSGSLAEFMVRVNDDIDVMYQTASGEYVDIAMGVNGVDYSLSYVDQSDTGELAGYTILTVNTVPEPSALTLLGLGGLALIRRRLS